MADDLPPDLQRMVGKLMKAAHRKGDRRGERKGFAAAVGLFLKAMSAADAGSGGALIPPPQVGCGKKRKKRKNGKRKPVAKAVPAPKAFRLTPAESVVYWKAMAEQALDTPEAVAGYAERLHAMTVKELAAEKAKAKYHLEQHAVVDRLAEALS